MSAIKNMRGKSHDTWISIIGSAVNQWKRQNDWSRETVADQIVQSHVNNHSHLSSGISFDTKGSGDEYRRQHTNANKIFRWLDEITKDNNLLPTNFIKSILLAMPVDMRLKAVNAMLIDLGLTAKTINQAEYKDPLEMLRELMHKTSEVNNAYAQLVDGIDPGELELALEANNSAMSALTEAKAVIQKMLIEKSVEKSNG